MLQRFRRPDARYPTLPVPLAKVKRRDDNPNMFPCWKWEPFLPVSRQIVVVEEKHANSTYQVSWWVFLSKNFVSLKLTKMTYSNIMPNTVFFRVWTRYPTVKPHEHHSKVKTMFVAKTVVSRNFFYAHKIRYCLLPSFSNPKTHKLVEMWINTVTVTTTLSDLHGFVHFHSKFTSLQHVTITVPSAHFNLRKAQ